MRARLKLVILGLAAQMGCGTEVQFFGGLAGKEHEPPPQPVQTVLKGTVEGVLAQAGFAVEAVDGASNNIQYSDLRISGGLFQLALPEGDEFRNIRVLVRKGNIVLKAVVPKIAQGETKDAGIINYQSTAVTLLLEAKVNNEGATLGSKSSANISKAISDILAKSLAGAIGDLFEMVQRIIAAGDVGSSGDLMFGDGALSQEFITANPLDYDGDGSSENSVQKFNDKLAEALAEFEIALPCYDQRLIRVVLVADFREGRVDGNCNAIDRFRNVEDDPADTMSIAGGVHKETPEGLLTPEERDRIHKMMGAWQPNRVKMYDDGTHGDSQAGDSMYTVTFDLPAGIRIGYKYTWGAENQGWATTEEWPGNSRIMEIKDMNGDHLAVRLDNFGDEASNKDKMNMRTPKNGGTGSVDFTTDANRDDFPDATEWSDQDNDCKIDWWKPGNVEPITVECQ